MKRILKTLKTSLLLIGISLLLWNCEKNELEEQPENISIENVQKIFSTQFKAKNFSFFKKEPIWINAQYFFKDDKQYIEIPFRETANYNLNKSATLSVDRLLAYKDSTGTLNVKIIHYFVTNNKKYPFDFNTTSYINLENFNGFVSVVNLENVTEKTIKIIKGKKSKQQFAVKEIDKEQRLLTKAANCVTYYEQVVYLVTWRYEYSDGSSEIINQHYITKDKEYSSCDNTGSTGEEEMVDFIADEENAGGVIEEEKVIQINDTNLKACMKTIVTDIKTLTNDLKGIITKFGGNSKGYNWELKDGSLGGSNTGATDPAAAYNHSTGTITTTFDSQAFKEASDLSWVRTILHESLHAYLSVQFAIDRPNWIATYPEMVSEWGKYKNWNDVQHSEFVRDYVNDIANSLKEYGNKKGYNLTDQFYNDLAWGGLTDTAKKDSLGQVINDSFGKPIMEVAPWFTAAFPNSSDRTRITNTIIIELTKKDKNGNTQIQKGTNAGC